MNEAAVLLILILLLIGFPAGIGGNLGSALRASVTGLAVIASSLFGSGRAERRRAAAQERAERREMIERIRKLQEPS